MTQGRIQEFWLGGGREFFFKGIGFGGHLKPPVGPGNALVGAQGAKPPEAPEF